MIHKAFVAALWGFNAGMGLICALVLFELHKPGLGSFVLFLYFFSAVGAIRAVVRS